MMEDEGDLSSSDSDQSMLSDDENDESEEDSLILPPIDDEEYRQLRSQVDLNPSDYPTRQAYIHAEERKHGRASPASIQARQEATAAYPQPEPFWIDWIAAVRSTMPRSNQEETRARLAAILALVRQCQNDYQSISVWMLYLEQVTSAYKNGHVEIHDVRTAYEDALSTAAYHYQESERVWSSYRDFELKVADSLGSFLAQGLPPEHYDAQITRIRELFMRELAITSAGSEEAYEDYRSWESMQGHKVPDSVKRQWDARKNWLKTREQYEQAIASTPDALTCYQTPPWDLLPSWMTYLEWELTKQYEKQQNLQPALGLCERAVVAFALSVDIWIKFCQLAVEYRESVGLSRVLTITQRATRNCSWSGKLWALYLHMVELVTPDQFPTIIETALQANIQEPDELALVHQAHLDFHWRQLGFFHSPASSDDRTASLQAFRAAMGRAKAHFGENQLAVQHQMFLCESLQYDAVLQQQGLAESVGQKVVAKYPQYEETWRSVIQTHMNTPPSRVLPAHVSLPTVRSWYKQGVVSVTQWPVQLPQEWKWFERLYGDVETYLDATFVILHKHTQLMALYNQSQESSSTSASVPDATATPVASRKERKAPAAKKTKRARSESGKEERPQKKKQKTEHVPVAVTQPTGEEGEEAPSCVVHVSNLPWKKDDHTPMDLDTLQSLLRDLLQSCGPIQDIRVIKDSQNKLTGFAFVEFTRPESATQAVALVAPQIGARTLRIELSKSHKEEDKLATVAAQKPAVVVPDGGFTDRNTVFASNLPFKATDAEIKQLFKKCKVKEIRLKRNSKNGFLLGYGYIEMEDAESVETALALDKKSFKGRTINVAKSEPKRKKKKQRLPEERPAVQSTKDSDAVPSTLRSMKKGSLFAPRALMKKAAAPATQETPSSGGSGESQEESKTPPTPKSNEDFRNMLFKK